MRFDANFAGNCFVKNETCMIWLGAWSYRPMRSSSSAAATIHEKSIAVLPFENRSEEL